MKEMLIKETDYGPLACLIGTWQGDQGMDVAPEPDDIERNPYYEVMQFEPGGYVTNAEEQKMVYLFYRQLVARKKNDTIFHDQSGYWMWDPATDLVIQSLAIPRGINLLAGGKAQSEAGRTVFNLESAQDNPDFGIIESPFLRQKARTVSFTHHLEVDGDTLSYREVTLLDIYDLRRFEHVDENTLTRVSES